VCVSCTLASGCGDAPQGSPSPTDSLAKAEQHIDFTSPAVTKYLGGLGPILEFGKDIAGIYSSFEDALYLTSKLGFILGFGADPDVNPLSVIMAEQIQAIQRQLTNITELITDSGWHQLELQGEAVFSDSMYAARRATEWSTDNTAPIAHLSSDWQLLDSLSRTGASTFADPVWFYWPYQAGVTRQNWAPEPAPNANRIFDWRLGLPRFVNAITARLLVLGVTRSDFRKDAEVRSELLGYRDTLKAYYDKAQSVSVKCQVQVPPSFTQGDFRLLPIYCTSLVTGARLSAGTAGNPLDTAPLIERLMDDAGFAPVRGMMTNLYELAWNVVGEDATSLGLVEQIPFKGMGLCVEPSSQPPSIHAPLAMRRCENAPKGGRNWNLERRAARASGSDYAARLRYANTDLCINVPWAAATIHNVLQLYPCSSGAPYGNELFDHSPQSQLTYGGLCFNLAGGVAVDGAAVQLYPCMGGQNEKWSFR
jgi:hypothetical protein